MNKLNIKSLTKEELVKLKRKIEEGSLVKLIDDRLDKISEQKGFCPVCQGPVTGSAFKLSFGPPDMKMQAKFDGLDCLEHFIKNFKNRKVRSE